MVSASTRPVRWKESKKKMAPTSTSVSEESSTRSLSSPAHTIKLVESPSHITQVLFKLMPVGQDLEQVNLSSSP